MTDNKSYADRLGKHFGNLWRDAEDATFIEEAEALEAELSQCLTAHAKLNDKVCALEAENAELKAHIEKLEGIIKRLQSGVY